MKSAPSRIMIVWILASSQRCRLPILPLTIARYSYGRSGDQVAPFDGAWPLVIVNFVLAPDIDCAAVTTNLFFRK
jgi:hypothetical protein